MLVRVWEGRMGGRAGVGLGGWRVGGGGLRGRRGRGGPGVCSCRRAEQSPSALTRALLLIGRLAGLCPGVAEGGACACPSPGALRAPGVALLDTCLQARSWQPREGGPVLDLDLGSERIVAAARRQVATELVPAGRP